MKYTQEQMYLQLCKLYGALDNWEDFEGFKEDLHAKLIMYFLDNPDDKVIVSKSRYRRLHDKGMHTWSADDSIADIMVKNKMSKHIEWIG